MFLFLYNFTKITIKSFESIRNYEKKIIPGTLDTWSMSRLAHRPSNPAYYIEDCRISKCYSQISLHLKKMSDKNIFYLFFYRQELLLGEQVVAKQVCQEYMLMFQKDCVSLSMPQNVPLVMSISMISKTVRDGQKTNIVK